MVLYKYKAVTATGEKIEGTYSAASKDDVFGMLRQNKHYPISVEEYIEKKDYSFAQIAQTVKIKDVAIFCRQFYTMLNAGVTIVNCLDILSQQTENRKMRAVVGDLFDLVQTGLTLSEAMKKHREVFPELLTNMVAAGEISGKLDTIMFRMSEHYEKENKLKNKLRGAMVYPTLLSIVSVFVVIFLITFVLPTFVSMFSGSGTELPGPTKVLLGMSSFIKTFWYLLLLLTGLAIYFLNKFRNSVPGRIMLDSLKLRLPIINSTTRKITTSRFTRTLSILLISGIPLIQALEMVSKVVGNVIVEEGIMSSIDEIRKGTSLSVPIKRMGIFPPMVASMINIGEESGSLDEILESTANYYDDEVETSVAKLTAMIEPLMIVVMAVVIGSIVVAMILPMFDMMSTIKV